MMIAGYLLSWKGRICFRGCSHIRRKDSSCWICLCSSIKSMPEFLTAGSVSLFPSFCLVAVWLHETMNLIAQYHWGIVLRFRHVWNISVSNFLST